MRKYFFVKKRKKDLFFAKKSGKRKTFSDCEFGNFKLSVRTRREASVLWTVATRPLPLRFACGPLPLTMPRGARVRNSRLPSLRSLNVKRHQEKLSPNNDLSKVVKLFIYICASNLWNDTYLPYIWSKKEKRRRFCPRLTCFHNGIILIVICFRFAAKIDKKIKIQ